MTTSGSKYIGCDAGKISSFSANVTNRPVVKQTFLANKKRDAASKSSVFQVQSTPKLSFDVDIVTLDHCYSKSRNSQSDLSHAEAAKYIVWPKVSPPQNIRSPDETVIDVESIDHPDTQTFELVKVRSLMTECERHVKSARPQMVTNEEAINRTGWTSIQNKIFNKLYKILMSARLSRVSCVGSQNEPILRRIYCDKHAKRLRQLFSSFSWDMELLSWLHTICMDHLHQTLLSDYLEMLQTIKSKCSSLIEKMISISDYRARMTSVSNESLDLLLKRPWDPLLALTNRSKLEKLPKNPVILVVPRMLSEEQSGTAQTRRMKQWTAQLSYLAKTICVPSQHHGKLIDRWKCFDAMVTAVKKSILKVRDVLPGRPIILLGWNFGALLASYIAATEPVCAVIALGYPLLGVNGLKGDADDIIMNSNTPTLFVVGEYATNCPIEEMETMRERMRAENSLVVVGGANNNLNVNFKTKKEKNLTQALVDKLVQAEISTYLTRILLTTTSSQVRVDLPANKIKKKKKWVSNPVRKVDLDVDTVNKKRKFELEKPPNKKMKLNGNWTESITPELMQSQQQDMQESCHLTFSSSSTGSLAALKPLSIQVPSLNVSPEAKVTITEEEASKQHKQLQDEQKTPLNKLRELPAFVQMSGHSGTTSAISMDKARQLLGSVVIKANKSKLESKNVESPTHDGITQTNQATTNVAFLKTQLNRHSNDSSSSQQIRNLLTNDRHTIPQSKSYSSTASKSLSPGQSLIKKTKMPATVVSSVVSKQLSLDNQKPSGTTSKTLSFFVDSRGSIVSEENIDHDAAGETNETEKQVIQNISESLPSQSSPAGVNVLDLGGMVNEPDPEK